MVDLLGYNKIDRLYEFTGGLSPILLLGPAGLGKKRWCVSKAEDFSGKSMTKIFQFPKVSDLETYDDIRSGYFRSSWVLDLSVVFNGKTTNSYVLPTLESFIKKSTNEFTRVFMHSDVQVPESLKSLATVVHVPLLSEDQLKAICDSRGYEQDEAEFAISYAQGVPGEMNTAFTILKRRSIIFELRELLLDDRISKMEDRIKQVVTKEDMIYLKNILQSFDTGNWTLFKEHEVEFLKRVKELIRNVLSLRNANAEISYVAVFHAAAHAYHGRV